MLLIFTVALVVRPRRLKAANSPPTQVKIDNFTFGPDTLTVPTNRTVTWVNQDDIPHTVASNDGLFRSKALDTEQSYSFTFTKPGTYAYYCTIHPKMVGKVVVQ
ncbi:MAG: cupredoxin family copper-binding protein [Acidobacteria bacterium]|nr:cupredoxin family copper-binding protein [Acidobacteriota bacterium]